MRSMVKWGVAFALGLVSLGLALRLGLPLWMAPHSELVTQTTPLFSLATEPTEGASTDEFVPQSGGTPSASPHVTPTPTLVVSFAPQSDSQMVYSAELEALILEHLAVGVSEQRRNQLSASLEDVTLAWLARFSWNGFLAPWLQAKADRGWFTQHQEAIRLIMQQQGADALVNQAFARSELTRMLSYMEFFVEGYQLTPENLQLVQSQLGALFLHQFMQRGRQSGLVAFDKNWLANLAQSLRGSNDEVTAQNAQALLKLLASPQLFLSWVLETQPRSQQFKHWVAQLQGYLDSASLNQTQWQNAIGAIDQTPHLWVTRLRRLHGQDNQLNEQALMEQLGRQYPQLGALANLSQPLVRYSYENVDPSELTDQQSKDYRQWGDYFLGKVALEPFYQDFFYQRPYLSPQSYFKAFHWGHVAATVSFPDNLINQIDRVGELALRIMALANYLDERGIEHQFHQVDLSHWYDLSALMDAHLLAPGATIPDLAQVAKLIKAADPIMRQMLPGERQSITLLTLFSVLMGDLDLEALTRAAAAEQFTDNNSDRRAYVMVRLAAKMQGANTHLAAINAAQLSAAEVKDLNVSALASMGYFCAYQHFEAGTSENQFRQGVSTCLARAKWLWQQEAPGVFHFSDTLALWALVEDSLDQFIIADLYRAFQAKGQVDLAAFDAVVRKLRSRF